MGAIETAGIGLGQGIISDIANQIIGGRAIKNQEQAQREQTIFNKEQQIDLFNKTGYEAQVKQMDLAGLNPAIMYAKGGAGGSTALATGNVQSPAMPTNIPKGMEISNMLAMQEAQIELAKSQTNKNNVEASKLAGADTDKIKSEIESMAKGRELTNSQIKEIATRLNVNEAEVRLKEQEIKESQSRIPVNNATVPKLNAETTNIKKDTEKKEAETNRIIQITPKDIDNIESEILTRRGQINIETFKQELEKEYPNLLNVSGKVIDNIIRAILLKFGMVDPFKREIPNK